MSLTCSLGGPHTDPPEAAHATRCFLMGSPTQRRPHSTHGWGRLLLLPWPVRQLRSCRCSGRNSEDHPCLLCFVYSPHPANSRSPAAAALRLQPLAPCALPSSWAKSAPSCSDQCSSLPAAHPAPALLLSPPPHHPVSSLAQVHFLNVSLIMFEGLLSLKGYFQTHRGGPFSAKVEPKAISKITTYHMISPPHTSLSLFPPTLPPIYPIRATLSSPCFSFH